MGETTKAAGRTGELPGMPPALELRLEVVGESVVVSYGGRALACYERLDQGMRNLAIVSLTRAGVRCVEVGRVFGMRPEHVSRLRRQVTEQGSGALVRVMGRPRKLDERERARVYELSDRGVAGVEIAKMSGVSEATISRLLKRRPARETERLVFGEPVQAGETTDVSGVAEVTGTDVAVSDTAELGDTAELSERGEVSELSGVLSARIGESQGRSVYAGAMLLYPFLEKAGAGGALSVLGSGPARRDDSTAVALAGVFAFALGASSLEGSKHLQPADAGLLAGIERFPHLRSLRPRLAALADSVDPLELQVALAKAMLDADSDPPSVFFVDEHFVAYTGSRPVAKGWNTRRRHAEPGRHETVIVDDRWRAVCFASGPPGELATGMLSPVDQLLEICGTRRLMIGFDRGGSYPKTFSALRERGVAWVTYRRAPLTDPAVKPRRSWIMIDGRRHYLQVADELVQLDDYGQCRQLTIYEHDKVALQILTSDLSGSAAYLAYTLRCRWRIENTFKYLEDHHGLRWLCDYQMNITPDTALVRNPERTEALARLRACEQTVTELERQLGQHHSTPNPADTNPAETLCMLKADLYTARNQVQAAKQALKPIPAKLPANTINPDATRATPRLNRRALQTVLRLLAYNAELDLARDLNTYLKDPDEYRTITRHLLHQPGHIHYTTNQITVTIEQPHAPRIHRALNLLIDQINNNPPKLAGDHRPITYQTSAKP
ncbi:MAG: putative transposase [Solirubrobacteraceae bacterium]